MAPSSANLLEFGKGGGGFLGQDKDVIIKSMLVKEHSFERHDKLTGEVTDKFEPGCMLEVQYEIEEPDDDNSRFVTQYYTIGNLPASRMIELGYSVDPKRPGGMGGYLPSTDNENPSIEGSFVILEGKTDIWEGCPHAQFISEFLNLGAGEFADKINAKGYAAFNGTRVHLGTKVLPKSRSAKADAKEKVILVPTKINSWGWEAQPASAPAAAPTKAKVGRPAKVAEPVQAEPAAAPAANGSGDARMIEVVKQAIKDAGGMLEYKALPGKVFPLTAKDGSARTKIVQGANNKDNLEAYSGEHWLWDAGSETLMRLEQ